MRKYESPKTLQNRMQEKKILKKLRIAAILLDYMASASDIPNCNFEPENDPESPTVGITSLVLTKWHPFRYNILI